MVVSGGDRWMSVRGGYWNDSCSRRSFEQWWYLRFAILDLGGSGSRYLNGSGKIGVWVMDVPWPVAHSNPPRLRCLQCRRRQGFESVWASYPFAVKRMRGSFKPHNSHVKLLASPNKRRRWIWTDSVNGRAIGGENSCNPQRLWAGIHALQKLDRIVKASDKRRFRASGDGSMNWWYTFSLIPWD